MAATVATAIIDLRIMCVSSGYRGMCFSHPICQSRERSDRFN